MPNVIVQLAFHWSFWERSVSAMQAAGYEPYDQLYGYVLKGNGQYITRHSGAREIVTKMDVKDIKVF